MPRTKQHRKLISVATESPSDAYCQKINSQIQDEENSTELSGSKDNNIKSATSTTPILI